MKSLCIVASFSLLMSAAALRGADNSPTTKPSSPPPALVYKSTEEEVKALRAQVEAQREQITKLSSELRDREQEVAQLRMQLRTRLSQLPQAQPFSLVPSEPQMPRGSVPQQFNGSTYYLVPLSEQPWQLKTKTVDHGEAPIIEPSGGILLDDRSGPTRELIHGK